MTVSKEYQFLVQGDGDHWYPLEIRPFDGAASAYFQSVWQRLAVAVEKACVLRDGSPPDWVKWKPWEWCGATRTGYEGRIPWIAWCGDQLVGFLNVWRKIPSEHESGRYILYIEHLAAFPGDQNTELWRRRYRHVGKALMAFAIHLSTQDVSDGRVGLHSENDDSLSFYRKIAADRGLPLFHAEKEGVIGPTPHGQRSDARLTYLETIASGALSFLEDYRDE